MIVIYEKHDLNAGDKDKDIRDITLADIRMSQQPSLIADVVLYVDIKQQLMKVLKHRTSREFKPRDVFSTDEFDVIIGQSIRINNSLGKSTLIPGTKKKRGQ